MKKNKLSKTLTIIGLGPMGQAMTKKFMSEAYKVTVWNRTKSKAEAMAKEGAIMARTVQEALEANDLIILSLTTYEIMHLILGGHGDVLQRKILVNLSSGTPDEARKAADWVQKRGGDLISGGMMTDPPMIGKPEAFAFYSGDQDTFFRYKKDLQLLGKTEYLGSDPGLSQLYNQALLDILFTSAAGVLHSMAMIRSAGISAKTFDPYVQDFLKTLPYFFIDMADEVDQGNYLGEQNNMYMMKASMDHVAQVSRDTKINTDLPDLIQKIYSGTVAKGFGKDGLSSIYEVLKENYKTGGKESK